MISETAAAENSGQKNPNRELDADVFAAQRGPVIYVLAGVSLLLTLPFVINNFVQGRYAVGAVMIVFVAVLAIDAWAIRRKRPAPIPLWTLVAPIVIGFALSIRVQHYVALVWIYPMVLLLFFIMPRRAAAWAAATMIVLIGAMLLAMIEFRYAIRAIVSLTLIGLLANIFVGAIEGLHRQLQNQALVDPLTGAYNRRHMDTLLNAALAAQSRGRSAATLIMIDIDHFKNINDAWGHSVGDEVLKAIAALIRRRARAPDTLFRVGGEEFLLLLPSADAADATVLAEDLRRLIAEADLHRGVRVTASLGVSPLRDKDTFDSWLQRADNALYRAKNGGRNQIAMIQAETASVVA